MINVPGARNPRAARIMSDVACVGGLLIA